MQLKHFVNIPLPAKCPGNTLFGSTKFPPPSKNLLCWYWLLGTPGEWSSWMFLPGLFPAMLGSVSRKSWARLESSLSAVVGNFPSLGCSMNYYVIRNNDDSCLPLNSKIVPSLRSWLKIICGICITVWHFISIEFFLSKINHPKSVNKCLEVFSNVLWCYQVTDAENIHLKQWYHILCLKLEEGELL